MSGPESELQKRLKGIQWQSQNCLSCIWFATTDPLNADLFDRAMCIHPKLKIYQLVVSGRDWCNLYEEIKQKQIEQTRHGFEERRKIRINKTDLAYCVRHVHVTTHARS